MVSCFLKNVTVTGAIIQEGETFLIARRGPNIKSPGMWESPGGKIGRRRVTSRIHQKKVKRRIKH